MDKLKYVRTKHDIIIFSATISHDTFKYLNPISAGFCVVRSDKEMVACYGESWSLGIKSNPKEDTELATREVFGIDALIKLEENG